MMQRKWPLDVTFMICIETARNLKQRGKPIPAQAILEVACLALEDRDARVKHPLASRLEIALSNQN